MNISEQRIRQIKKQEINPEIDADFNSTRRSILLYAATFPVVAALSSIAGKSFFDSQKQSSPSRYHPLYEQQYPAPFDIARSVESSPYPKTRDELALVQATVLPAQAYHAIEQFQEQTDSANSPGITGDIIKPTLAIGGICIDGFIAGKLVFAGKRLYDIAVLPQKCYNSYKRKTP